MGRWGKRFRLPIHCYTRSFVILAVPSILFGAGFTVAISFALGTLLLDRLRVALYRQEAALLAFVTGSACLSLATFFLCLMHQARRDVFLWGGLAVIAGAVWLHRGESPRKSLPMPPAGWMVLFFVVLTAFFIAYFFNSLAPEISPDGSGYHLGNVVRYGRSGGFDWKHHSMYSYLSQGTEMLFLVAFSFGGHSSAAMVHFAFLTALPLLIACYGIRWGFPRVGMFAAILAYASPVVGIDGISAYNDLALVTVVFAVFYVLQVWDHIKDYKLLIIIGLLSGFSYAIKYTACLTLPFALGFVAWRLWREQKLWGGPPGPRGSPRTRFSPTRPMSPDADGPARGPGCPLGSDQGVRPTVNQRGPTAITCLLLVLSAALLMILPWAVRNWIWLGNPFAPFLNRWFTNPYYHPGAESRYLSELGQYTGLNHYWEIPLQLAVRGKFIPGILGPVFLLVPFALLALRHSHGRRLLVAAAVFGIPAYFNTGARFLIPSIPFVSLAMGLALAKSWGILPTVAMFQALVCWPGVLAMYCDPWAWRVRSIPVRAALRKEPEAEFLLRQVPGYGLKSAIEQATAPGDKIFSFRSRPEAYLDREIVVGYESNLGNLAQDILWTAAGALKPPVDRQQFRFAPVTTRGIRIVQKASADSEWSLAEVRLFWGGREVPHAPDWHITAWPNAPEVGLAFDDNLGTRWSTWQPMSPKDRVQIEFGQPRGVDEVLLEYAVAGAAQVSVEVLGESSRWIRIAGRPEVSRAGATDLRRLATQELRASGIGYLLIDDSDFGMANLNQYTSSWGITQLAEANGTHFFRID
jgi:hypothetical protein